MLGALLVGALTSALRDSFRFWEITIAIVFITRRADLPAGLIGLFAPLERWLQSAPPVAHRRSHAPARVQPGGAAARCVVDARRASSVGEVLILDKLSLAIERPASSA